MLLVTHKLQKTPFEHFERKTTHLSHVPSVLAERQILLNSPLLIKFVKLPENQQPLIISSFRSHAIIDTS